MKIFLLLITLNSTAQTVKYAIKGKVENLEKNKFVYLYIFNYPDTNQSFKCVPIVDNKFIFDDVKPLHGKLMLSGAIFLSEIETGNYSTFLKIQKAKSFERMWRIIDFENFEITIESNEIIKDAKVTGGLLNKERDEMNTAIATGDFEHFFKNHNDSPISISFLYSIWQVNHLMNMTKDDLKRIYGSFSDRLKNSLESKKLQPYLTD